MGEIEAISKLYKLFKQKKWVEQDEDDFVYDNLCLLLRHLNDPQRALMMELIERYKWIPLTEYISMLFKVFKSIDTETLDGITRIILFPIHKLKDEEDQKIKSGHSLLYNVRGIQPQLRIYNNITFEEIETYDKLRARCGKGVSANEAIYLIDDFLGSDATISSTLYEIEKIKPISELNISVFVIACQQHTVNYLNKKNIPIHTTYIGNKGISDNYSSPLLEEKIRLMEEIEKLIPNNDNYKFGYNACEALITLSRTPNNTFPIFWKQHKIGNERYEAPFSRF